MIRGVTITGREFLIEARWGGLTSDADYLEKWKATRRSAAEPYYIAGSLKAKSPMVVAMRGLDHVKIAVEDAKAGFAHLALPVWSAMTCATHAVTLAPVGKWRNSLGP